MLALKDREVGERLRRILARNDLNEDDFDTVVSLVRGSTAIAEAERSAQEFAREAAAELRTFPRSSARETLEHVCDYVVERRI
jgi:geranylgeranyl pyrophosphate synthase